MPIRFDTHGLLEGSNSSSSATPLLRLDRLIVITDEQSQDGISDPWIPKSYVINVAPYANGVSYRNGWNRVDGWSETVVDFIREIELMDVGTEYASQNA